MPQFHFHPGFPTVQHLHHHGAAVMHQYVHQVGGGYHDAEDYGFDDGSSDGDLE
jgi:surface antigen